MSELDTTQTIDIPLKLDDEPNEISEDNVDEDLDETTLSKIQNTPIIEESKLRQSGIDSGKGKLPSIFPESQDLELFGREFEEHKNELVDKEFE